MKKITQRFLSLILMIMLTASCFCVTASAELGQNVVPGWPAGPELTGDACLLMDVKTGTVLYSKNGDKAEYPASITKLMTALLTLENANLNDVITFSKDAVYAIEYDSANIAVVPGEQLTVEQCLYALLLQSANEVANGLAEHVGGSMAGFAIMMTERARQLGCVNTNFVNANGLHDPNHYTCAYDMALIMKEIIKNPTFLEICAAHRYIIEPTNLQPERRYLAQKHKMMIDSEWKYEGTVCGKTGFTPEAMNTLVTYAKRGDMELIGVSMNSNWKHYEDTIRLFDYGFDNFTTYNMAAVQNSSESADDMLSVSSALFGSEVASITLDESSSWITLPNTIPLNSVDTHMEMDTSSQDASVAHIFYSVNGFEFGRSTLKVVVPETQESFDFAAHETAAVVPLEAPSARGHLFVNIWKLAGAIVLLIVLFILFRSISKARRRRNSIIRVKSTPKEVAKRSKRSQKRKKPSDTFDPYDR